MKDLIKEVLAYGDFGSFQSTALLLFAFLMAAVAIWIFAPGSKAYYERIADEVVKGGES